MSRAIYDLTMIAGGIVLLTPWCLLLFHFYTLYYGFKAKHLGIEHGRIGTVVSTLLQLSASLGIGMILFFCQDLLALWGLLDRARFWFLELVGVGLFASLFVDVLAWKLCQRRFLAFMENAEPRCEKCQYILTGLKPVKKTLRCPECGHIESVASVQDRFRLDLKVAEHDRRGEY